LVDGTGMQVPHNHRTDTFSSATPRIEVQHLLNKFERLKNLPWGREKCMYTAKCSYLEHTVHATHQVVAVAHNNICSVNTLANLLVARHS